MSPFNYRVTGIGRDDLSSLNQKQSRNISDEYVVSLGINRIDSLNSLNNSTIEDSNYLLWGDNNGPLHFSSYEGTENIDILNRIWKVKLEGNDIQNHSFYISFNKSLLGLDHSTHELWLAIDNSTNESIDLNDSQLIVLEQTNDTFYTTLFALPIDTNNSFKFTLYKAPPTFVIPKVEVNNCKTSVGFNIINSPNIYQFDLLQDGQLMYSNQETSNKLYFGDLVHSNYTYQITTETGETIQDRLDLSLIKPAEIHTMADILLLENDKKSVKAVDEEIVNTLAEILWKKDHQIVSRSNDLMINQPGNYSLEVVSKDGCRSVQNFEAKRLEKDWQGLYPNPVKHHQNFYIKLPLSAQQTKVTIKDYLGRVLKNSILQSGTSVYEDHIDKQGQYLIELVNDKGITTYQLIVN